MKARGPWLAALFAVLAALPFLGKPLTMDEPFFLAAARHLAAEPGRGFDFELNWYGRAAPFREINNTPPLFYGALAAAVRAAGEEPWALRALFLPLDAVLAFSLYLLAARFLRRPLLPVLAVLAGPAALLNLGHLMPEKLACALAFPALYAAARGTDEKDARWLAAAGLLFGLAGLVKYNALFLLPPALAYAWAGGAGLLTLAPLALGAAAPAAGWLLWQSSAAGAAGLVLAEARALPVSSPAHTARAALAFLGGCAGPAALWSAWSRGRARDPRLVAGLALAAGLLFLPALDIAPLVRPLDRGLGWALALAGLWGAGGVLLSRGRGRALWAPWLLSALLLSALYWCVMARLTLLALPPLVLGLAESLEASLSDRALLRLEAASLAVLALLGGALGWTDLRYAQAQKEMAARVSERYASPGRGLWYTGHWGFQHYMERAGARPLDAGRGGWAEVRPGDIVVVPRVNANQVRPARSFRARVARVTVDGPLPVRLISGWTGEGGFYSSVTGFLPFSIGYEPLEEFELVEPLPPGA